MNLHTELITDFSLIENIYTECIKKDFPSNELKPLSVINKKWIEHQYDCFGLYSEAQLIGYAFFFKIPNSEKQYYYLIDYLAILPKYRNRGCGSVFLKQLSDKITDAECMVLEVEDPGKEEDGARRVLQQKRIEFYLRNGYINTGNTVRVFGVHYLLLEVPCGGRSLSTEEIREIYETMYKSMLLKSIFRNEFKWTDQSL